MRTFRIALGLLSIAGLGALAAGDAGAKKGGTGGLAPLSSLPVPQSPEISRFVRDTGAAQKLGKALFWDMQAGSDGRTACATCHYDAGTDNRSRNQINPRGPAGFTVKGPNAQLTAADFPLHRLADPDDAASQVLADSDNVVGSQGVVPSTFRGIIDGDPLDSQAFGTVDSAFQLGGVNVRRSTGRNTPSVVNAVFNFRQFWDGRAQNDFNGVNPFGARDASARVGQANAAGGFDKVAVSLTNASLASQATGPPGNPVEMSADGRTLSDIGRKLLALRPLGAQRVSASDSLLGDLAGPSGRGLRTSYGELIRQAFKPEWWNAEGSATAANGRSYSLMQFNFPLYWGLAIQAYESTLVSDQTPVDRFLAGDASALGAEARQGMNVFAGAGDCMECHAGAALTTATVAEVAREGAVSASQRGLHDTGFFNIGVRPSASDPGNGGTDPFGAPLSIAALNAQAPAAPPGGVDGSFKTPGLRNVALTAPFFHNGGQMTLSQVVDFYSRGGDFNAATGPNEIAPLGLSQTDKKSLVAFLEALTDPRVRDQAAPFDHPQLFVPVGEQTNGDGSVITDADGRAVDCFKEIGATGAGGGAPLPQFPAFSGPPCDAVPTGEGGGPPDTAITDAPPAVTVRVPEVTLPGSSCRSRRVFTIRLWRPRGDRIRRVTVTVNARKVADLRGRRLRRAPVDLRGLPRGTIRVKVVVRTANGRELMMLRRYRTCTRSAQ
ncbi:MAG: cytochrome C peroxidase [Actinobacteria bacterium]|nr:MAG: cytochrome C peroxidase [Actinomycetota bacterium]